MNKPLLSIQNLEISKKGLFRCYQNISYDLQHNEILRLWESGSGNQSLL
jgi:ABC-type phosphonate transport system ATPase subunit